MSIERTEEDKARFSEDMARIERHNPAPRPGPLPGADLLRTLEATYEYLGEIATAAACMRGVIRLELSLLRSGAPPAYSQVILDRNVDYINTIRHRSGLL